MKVACVGVGNVGRSWALKFASAGNDVVLWDQNEKALDAALDGIRVAIVDMVTSGIQLDPEQVTRRIVITDSLVSAVADADYVQESVIENVDIKKQVFSLLDQHAKDSAILASSTSAILASEFLEDIDGRQRCLIAHPVNPPHIIPLVELCGSPWTDSAVIEKVKTFMQALGQAPIVVRKEVDGFVLNRLQWALLGEAIHLVDQGYCSAEEIDLAITKGLAMRWSFLGAFEVGHLNSSEGLQGYFDGLGDSIRKVQASLKTDYLEKNSGVDKTIKAAHAELEARFPVSELNQHQAWRDRRILRLKQFLDNEEN